VSEEENARQIQRMRDALVRLRAASLVRAAALAARDGSIGYDA
jgi:hypothetical protein